MFLNGPINLLFISPLHFFSFCVAFIIAISFHEFCHALVADRLGDSTPRYQGRLTLNPLAHLDPLGTFLALIVGFGWGRPVQFNPWNLKNPRRDEALISIAGPTANFLMAAFFSVLFRIVPAPGNEFFLIIIQLNVVLGVFNLIPIAPLDGFKVVSGLLPRELAYTWNSCEKYGSIILLILFLSPIGIGSLLSPVVSAILRMLLG